MPASEDTIVAPATPSGTSALALVRMTGPECAALAGRIFGEPPLAPRAATHRAFRSRTGDLIDDVVATFFAQPNSSTGEDVLEVSTHGNPLIVQRVIEDLLDRGCRLAEPGEFTRRAFLHGRLDLSQAEAVMDLIHARSESALAAAHQQLQGSLSRHLNELIASLVPLIARVEAYIDFPEEDLPPEDRTALVEGVQRVLRSADRLLATRHYGDLLREGIRTILVGEPNVGKSSLLNALLGRDRALVSPEPGTTRDYLEERLTVGSHTLRLIDTAGLNPAAAAIERLGIEKTMERAAEADLFLIVLDATRPEPILPAELRARLDGYNSLVVVNKCDMIKERAVATLQSLPFPTVRTSATTGAGIPELATAIGRVADRFKPELPTAEMIAINARHADALRRASTSLSEATLQLTGKPEDPTELLASNLRSALDALGEIGGRIDHERVLDELFSTFCIGK